MIAIHIALYGWLRSSGGWRMRPETRPTPALVTLRLLPSADAPSPRRENAPKAALTPPRTRDTFAPARAPVPRPDGAPAPNTAPAITQADAIAAPSPPASQASQPPLNLALPSGDGRRINPRNPALDDPRANTGRTTAEQRMAASLDTRVIEEDLGDGRRRFRRGDECVIVTPSRIGQLMPFNEAAARTPSLVSACP